MRYIPRLADALIEEAIRISGTVSVEGMRWCGKSTTCARHARTILDGEDMDEDGLAARREGSLGAGGYPILLDEWEAAPLPWDAIGSNVPRDDCPGKLILVGSKRRSCDSRRSAKAEWVTRIRMRPMSLFESGDGDRSVSLASLLSGEDVICFSPLSLEDYARLICRGGWPSAVLRPEEGSAFARLVFRSLVTKDMFLEGKTKLGINAGLACRFLLSYVRSVGSPRSASSFAKEIGASWPTAHKLLSVLEDLYVSEDLPAWRPRIRGKTAIRTSPVRHLTDPSISAAALSATPDWLMKDIRTFGLLFEELAVRDIRTYGEAHGAKAYHYRDKAGREADLVLQFPDGRWALIEVKMREQEVVDEAARNLIRLSEDIDELHQPAFLMVVTHGDAGFRREDGVYQIPLGCLRP